MTNAVGTIHVGVAIIVKDERGHVLVGKRLGKHGYGTWCPPGGHLEYGETIDACVRRELLEETGMVATSIKQLTTISDVLSEVVGKQYITIWAQVEVERLEPVNAEPEKCAGWEFHPIFSIPQPRFLAVTNYLNDIVERGECDHQIVYIPKVSSELKLGDYVFACKFSDAMPSDPWHVGHVSEINDTYISLETSGRSGWNRAQKITPELGSRIVNEYPKLEYSRDDYLGVAKIFGLV